MFTVKYRNFHKTSTSSTWSSKSGTNHDSTRDWQLSEVRKILKRNESWNERKSSFRASTLKWPIPHYGRVDLNFLKATNFKNDTISSNQTTKPNSEKHASKQTNKRTALTCRLSFILPLSMKGTLAVSLVSVLRTTRSMTVALIPQCRPCGKHNHLSAYTLRAILFQATKTLVSHRHPLLFYRFVSSGRCRWWYQRNGWQHLQSVQRWDIRTRFGISTKEDAWTFEVKTITHRPSTMMFCAVSLLDRLWNGWNAFDQGT